MGVSRPACRGLSDVDAFVLGVVKIKIEKKRVKLKIIMHSALY